ncbi:odh [Scenedesmus sp. PABB004]|nr:odh [Scenedesmus sp. PABB004]
MNPSTLADLRVVVCGSGHGAKTAAAMAGRVTKHTSILLSDTPRYRARAAELSAAIAAHGGLAAHAVTVGDTPIVGHIASVTCDAASVVPDADVLIVVLPADAHEGIIADLAPHLRSQLVVFMPGTSALDLLLLRRALGKRCEEAFAAGLTYAAIKTLPWATRERAIAEVHMRGVKGHVNVAAFPSTPMSRFTITAVLDALCDAPGAQTRFQVEDHWLEAVLGIPYNYGGNPILHTGIMYAQWKDWAGEELDEPPKFYHGTTQFTADTLEALWSELHATQAALAAALGLREPPSRLAHVRSMMVSKYEAVVADPSTLLAALHSNDAWKHSLHPHKRLDNGKVVPDLHSRYLSEDIPFGLVAIKGVATLLRVPTPAIDRVVVWAQRHLGRQYVDPDTGALLDNEWVAKSGAPQRTGASTPEELLQFVPAGVLITNAAAVALATTASVGALDEVLSSAASLMGALSLGRPAKAGAAGSDDDDASAFAIACDAAGVGVLSDGVMRALSGSRDAVSPFAAAFCQLRSGSFSAFAKRVASGPLGTVAE